MSRGCFVRQYFRGSNPGEEQRRKAPDPVEPAEKKKPERRPEDKIIYKDAKTIGAPPKNR